jgi:hypothetical protein
MRLLFCWAVLEPEQWSDPATKSDVLICTLAIIFVLICLGAVIVKEIQDNS